MRLVIGPIAFLSLLSQVAHGAMINVSVGGQGTLKYDPPVVNATIGDIVRFTFLTKNHTVTESTFESPCLPKPQGFDTGFIPISPSTTSGFPVADLTVRSLDPVWVYCRQSNHCQQGMVFAVNPGDKFAPFLAKAIAPYPPPPSSSPSPSPSPAPAPPTTTTAPTAQRTTPTPTGTSNTTSTSTDATPGPSSVPLTGVEHRVLVGNSGLLNFVPTNLTANVGDVIIFDFRAKNHTVTASSFDSPCRPLSLTATNGAPGFDSGFIPVDPEAEEFPTFSVIVNDTNPIWVYCKQGNHCGQGMVFSANADEQGPKSFVAFRQLARQSSGSQRRFGGAGAPLQWAVISGSLAITLFSLFA